MQLSTPIPASRLHPVFAQIVRTTQQAYGMPTMPPPRSPEEVRLLLDNRKTNFRQPQDKHPAPPIGSADAI